MTNPFEGRSNRLVLLIFLAVALYASYALIQPYIQPIILALLIGMLTVPAHDWLVVKLNGRKNSAAIVSCLLLSLVLLIPSILVMIAILKQGVSYSSTVREWADGGNVHQLLGHPWVIKIKQLLGQLLPEDALHPETIKAKVLDVGSGMGKQFVGISTAMLGSITTFFLNFTLMLFVLFFVLRDHEKLIRFFRHALPLSRSQEDALLADIKKVSKSALLGSLLTAITQGFVGGIGLWMAGFPALFWGTMMAFASLIPFVGTALIWVPAAIYLFVTGETGWGIFMVVWGVVVVGSIDNFLRPLFMQGASMSTVVVFFSLLGGLQVFGLIGLLYGPLIFSITLVLFHLYEKEFSNFLDDQDGR
ncbi:AI-2E family transporter [Corallincola luteus]|uniref:AI-2E family transporter n=1 Tax=Corallincola luteus TaxID=1775177 RepID=A0ABY2ANB7_9GAMM|nr:AI-2E family transporter [Corallincola luteus]TCI04695.1 AI-2E family transporter [Corallincola luteus]